MQDEACEETVGHGAWHDVCRRSRWKVIRHGSCTEVAGHLRTTQFREHPMDCNIHLDIHRARRLVRRILLHVKTDEAVN